jgi:hypothetical protein
VEPRSRSVVTCVTASPMIRRCGCAMRASIKLYTKLIHASCRLRRWHRTTAHRCSPAGITVERTSASSGGGRGFNRRDLPPALTRSITWDQDTEMACHLATTDKLGAPVYFATLDHPGNAAPTRTPTDCFATTSPRASASPTIHRRTCWPSNTNAIIAPAWSSKIVVRHPDDHVHPIHPLCTLESMT